MPYTKRYELWREIAACADPAGRAPSKKFKRLVVHAATQLYVGVITRQHMEPVDIATAFLDGAEIRGSTDTVQRFFIHVYTHPTRIVVSMMGRLAARSIAIRCSAISRPVG